MINTSKPLTGWTASGLSETVSWPAEREVDMMSRSAELRVSEPECRGQANSPFKLSSALHHCRIVFLIIRHCERKKKKKKKKETKIESPTVQHHQHALASCIISAVAATGLAV
jgi:hypothetical protein